MKHADTYILTAWLDSGLDDLPDEVRNETRLWRTVIKTALNDVLLPPLSGSSGALRELNRMQSRDWLLSGDRDSGTVFLCAGFEPEVLRNRLEKIINFWETKQKG